MYCTNNIGLTTISQGKYSVIRCKTGKLHLPRQCIRCDIFGGQFKLSPYSVIQLLKKGSQPPVMYINRGLVHIAIVLLKAWFLAQMILLTSVRYPQKEMLQV